MMRSLREDAIRMFDDSYEDNAVTVRDRDTMEQIRLPIDELVTYIQEKITF